MTSPRPEKNLTARNLNAGMRSSSRARAAAAALAIAGVLAAACPVSGLAAGAKPLTVNYSVAVKPLALARGTTVKAKATITSPEAKVKSWWSKKSVSTVVRKGVNGGFQTPYSSEGYRCTPKVRGELTSFICKLQGADVPTSVRLSFAVVYRGDTASG